MRNSVLQGEIAKLQNRLQVREAANKIAEAMEKAGISDDTFQAKNDEARPKAEAMIPENIVDGIVRFRAALEQAGGPELRDAMTASPAFFECLSRWCSEQAGLALDFYATEIHSIFPADSGVTKEDVLSVIVLAAAAKGL